MDDLVEIERRTNDVRHNLAILLRGNLSYFEESALESCNNILNEIDKKVEKIKNYLTEQPRNN